MKHVWKWACFQRPSTKPATKRKLAAEQADTTLLQGDVRAVGACTSTFVCSKPSGHQAADGEQISWVQLAEHYHCERVGLHVLALDGCSVLGSNLQDQHNQLAVGQYFGVSQLPRDEDAKITVGRCVGPAGTSGSTQASGAFSSIVGHHHPAQLQEPHGYLQALLGAEHDAGHVLRTVQEQGAWDGFVTVGDAARLTQLVPPPPLPAPLPASEGVVASSSAHAHLLREQGHASPGPGMRGPASPRDSADSIWALDANCVQDPSLALRRIDEGNESTLSIAIAAGTSPPGSGVKAQSASLSTSAHGLVARTASVGAQLLPHTAAELQGPPPPAVAVAGLQALSGSLVMSLDAAHSKRTLRTLHLHADSSHHSTLHQTSPRGRSPLPAAAAAAAAAAMLLPGSSASPARVDVVPVVPCSDQRESAAESNLDETVDAFIAELLPLAPTNGTSHGSPSLQYLSPMQRTMEGQVASSVWVSSAAVEAQTCPPQLHRRIIAGHHSRSLDLAHSAESASARAASVGQMLLASKGARPSSAEFSLLAGLEHASCSDLTAAGIRDGAKRRSRQLVTRLGRVMSGPRGAGAAALSTPGDAPPGSGWVHGHRHASALTLVHGAATEQAAHQHLTGADTAISGPNTFASCSGVGCYSSGTKRGSLDRPAGLLPMHLVTRPKTTALLASLGGWDRSLTLSMGSVAGANALSSAPLSSQTSLAGIPAAPTLPGPPDSACVHGSVGNLRGSAPTNAAFAARLGVGDMIETLYASPEEQDHQLTCNSQQARSPHAQEHPGHRHGRVQSGVPLRTEGEGFLSLSTSQPSNHLVSHLSTSRSRLSTGGVTSGDTGLSSLPSFQPHVATDDAGAERAVGLRQQHSSGLGHSMLPEASRCTEDQAAMALIKPAAGGSTSAAAASTAAQDSEAPCMIRGMSAAWHAASWQHSDAHAAAATCHPPLSVPESTACQAGVHQPSEDAHDALVTEAPICTATSTVGRKGIYNQGRLLAAAAAAATSTAAAAATAAASLAMPRVLSTTVRIISHPVTKQQAVLVVFKDKTERVAADEALAELTENQLGMISQMFPRHILEYLAHEPHLPTSGVGVAAAAAGALRTQLTGLTGPSSVLESTQLARLLSTSMLGVHTGSVSGQPPVGTDVKDCDHRTGVSGSLIAMCRADTSGSELLNNLGQSTMTTATSAAISTRVARANTHLTGPVGALARSHKDVTVLFMDIVGFTSMSKDVEPAQVMGFLNHLFSFFDDLVDAHQVHKVETAGDCYIVSAGVVGVNSDGFLEVLESHDAAASAARVMAFAKDMLAAASQVRMPHNGQRTKIRIGLHTGDCTSGLIGSRLPKFSIFGDTMNTASRMESTAPYGRIQVTQATHALLPAEAWEATGGVEVKGKGTLMTYLWQRPAHAKHADIRQGSAALLSVLGKHMAGDGMPLSFGHSLHISGGGVHSGVVCIDAEAGATHAGLGHSCMSASSAALAMFSHSGNVLEGPEQQAAELSAQLRSLVATQDDLSPDAPGTLFTTTHSVHARGAGRPPAPAPATSSVHSLLMSSGATGAGSGGGWGNAGSATGSSSAAMNGRAHAGGSTNLVAATLNAAFAAQRARGHNSHSPASQLLDSLQMGWNAQQPAEVASLGPTLGSLGAASSIMASAALSAIAIANASAGSVGGEHHVSRTPTGLQRLSSGVSSSPCTAPEQRQQQLYQRATLWQLQQHGDTPTTRQTANSGPSTADVHSGPPTGGCNSYVASVHRVVPGSSPAACPAAPAVQGATEAHGAQDAMDASRRRSPHASLSQKLPTLHFQKLVAAALATSGTGGGGGSGPEQASAELSGRLRPAHISGYHSAHGSQMPAMLPPAAPVPKASVHRRSSHTLLGLQPLKVLLAGRSMGGSSRGPPATVGLPPGHSSTFLHRPPSNPSNSSTAALQQYSSSGTLAAGSTAAGAKQGPKSWGCQSVPAPPKPDSAGYGDEQAMPQMKAACVSTVHAAATPAGAVLAAAAQQRPSVPLPQEGQGSGPVAAASRQAVGGTAAIQQPGDLHAFLPCSANSTLAQQPPHDAAGGVSLGSMPPRDVPQQHLAALHALQVLEASSPSRGDHHQWVQQPPTRQKAGMQQRVRTARSLNGAWPTPQALAEAAPLSRGAGTAGGCDACAPSSIADARTADPQPCRPAATATSRLNVGGAVALGRGTAKEWVDARAYSSPNLEFSFDTVHLR